MPSEFDSKKSVDESTAPDDIDAFVKKVIGCSHLLQKCADAALVRAHEQYVDGDIGYADYSDALQQKLDVIKSCVDMTNAAGSVLADVAEHQLAPVEEATRKLTEAAEDLADLENGITVVAELVGAAAALSSALALPSVASIAAAGAAIYKVADQIAPDAKDDAAAE